MEEALKAGSPSYLINDVNGIDPAWLDGVDTVGISSGASAPEILVDQVVKFFQEQGASVEELVTREENVHFALPPELNSEVDQLPVV